MLHASIILISLKDKKIVKYTKILGRVARKLVGTVRRNCASAPSEGRLAHYTEHLLHQLMVDPRGAGLHVAKDLHRSRSHSAPIRVFREYFYFVADICGKKQQDVPCTYNQ